MTGTVSAAQLATAAFEARGPTGASLKIEGRLDAAGVGASWQALPRR
jgi:hypothetical protein